MDPVANLFNYDYAESGIVTNRVYCDAFLAIFHAQLKRQNHENRKNLCVGFLYYLLH